MTPFIRVRDHGAWVREVSLHRSDARNAISTSLAVDLTAALERVCADPATRAVVLTGEGPSFCVGADLKERSRFTQEELAAQRPVFNAMFAAVRAVPVPVITVVQGHALGGGLEIALCGDVIVAEPDAVLGLPEVRVGLIPGGGGTQLLARRVGRGRAASLLFTGRHLTGIEAATWGVVDHVSAPGEAFTTAVGIAESVAAASPASVRAAKQALAASVPGLQEGLAQEEALWREVISGPDRVEGITAFVEKRAPQWADAPDAGAGPAGSTRDDVSGGPHGPSPR